MPARKVTPKKQSSDSLKVAMKYENTDALAPLYVEGVQGKPTPKGMLHVSFFSEYIKPRELIRPEAKIIDAKTSRPNMATVQVSTPDPYAFESDGEVTIVRHIETSVVMSKSFIKEIIPWLQEKLNELPD